MNSEQDFNEQAEKKLEMELEKREEAFYEHTRMMFENKLHEEKEVFQKKLNDSKKIKNNCEFLFILTCSLISTFVYHEYNMFESEVKKRIPFVYDNLTKMDWNISKYNNIECALINTGYHYVVYKIIINRFIVVKVCMIVGMVVGMYIMLS